MILLYILEILGTVAFAVSGACVAIEKKMDILGVAILGVTTAVGGGIIRDILLGVTPPVAFREPIYGLIAVVVSLLVFLPALRPISEKQNKLYFRIIDSIGLAVFTVIGVRAGMQHGNIYLAIFVGVVTGVGGGVMRDLFAGNKPYIFMKHFYACASIIGAVITAILWGFGETVSMVIGAAIILTLRLLAAKFRWSLPKA